MKVTVEIDEKEIKETVLNLVVSRAVDTVERKLFNDEFGNGFRRVYSEAIKDSVRALLKEHVDDVTDRAVNAAGQYIGKKGLKKMIDEDKI